jgi:acyl-CoA thioester hydrolase
MQEFMQESMHLKNNIFSYKIYYEDTDAGGVVYYANYLRFLERARTDFLERSGISSKSLYEQGNFFAVKSVKGEYLKPAFYGDYIDIEVSVRDIKKVSFVICYKIFKDNINIFNGETVLVSIDKNFKINKIPEKIVEFLSSNLNV